MGGGEIAGLEIGAELAEKLADRATFTRARATSVRCTGTRATSASAVMVMMVRSGLAGLLVLEVLLNGRVGLLGGRNISRLEVLGKLAELLGDGTVALRR